MKTGTTTERISPGSLAAHVMGSWQRHRVAPRPATTVTARCAWCGKPFGEGAKRMSGRTLCPACGVATTYPWPTDDDLERAYTGWYRPGEGRFAGPGDVLLRRSRSALARRLAVLAPPGPVLDVGAGDGTLLDALRASGRDALGIERSSERADVVDRELADLDAGLAAVVFWHSLEHLPDPQGALREVSRLLVPRGVLVIALPNAGSLQARAFGDRWFALDLPRHLTHIPAQALLARVRQEGFEVERVSFARGGQVVFGWVHGLVGLLPGHPDLYDAIRRAPARRRPMSGRLRVGTIVAGVALLAPAALCAAAEVALRRGGTVYLEARRR